jgi:hypothetical protein
MSLNIKNKRSAVAGSTPTPAQLEDGEIGVNYNSTDPALYIKDSTGTVVRIAGDGAVGTTPADATTTSKGVVQLADAAAVTAGTAGRVVDAAQLKVVADSVAAEDLWDRSGTELTPKTAGDDVFTSGDVKVGNTTASPNISLNADGSAEFASDLTGDKRLIVKGRGSNANVGFGLFETGAGLGPSISTGGLARDIEFYTGNGSTTVLHTTFKADLSSEFKGDMKIGGTLPASPNISLNADGSAAFVGGVESAGGDITNNSLIQLGTGTSNKAGIKLFTDKTLPGTAGITAQINASDGSATFAGSISGSASLLVGTNKTIDSTQDSNGLNFNNSLGQLSIFGSSTANTLFRCVKSNGAGGASETVNIKADGTTLIGGTLPASPNISLDASGTGTFAGDVVASNPATSGQSLLGKHGALLITRVTSNTDKCIRLTSGGVEKVAILANGSAEFAGDMKIGGTLPASPNIELKADGSASFKSQAVNIDTSGRLLVGTSSNTDNYGLQVDSANGNVAQFTRYGTDGASIAIGSSRGTQGAKTALGNNDYGGLVTFKGYDGSNFQTLAWLGGVCDGQAPASGDSPGLLVFSTTAAGSNTPTPRMTIKEDGVVAINASDSPNGEVLFASSSVSTSGAAAFRVSPTSGTYPAVIFYDGINTDCGSIDVDTTANTTAYTTSSDYRLKQDVEPLVGSIDRVLQLKPCKWNWVNSPETKGEGFLAHEAQAVVPESVTGTKDAVDDDGNPVYQGIDQSKLVPLLTAALQEALAKIETLEAKVAALEAA